MARQRDLALIVASVGLSAAGDWIALTALILEVKDYTDSALAVSALFIAVWAPLVVFAGPAGVLVDRLENVRLLKLVSLAQAAIAIALAFTFSSLAAVLALTVLLGLGTAVSQPAEFALVPAAAGKGELVKANGWVETSRYAGFALGPAAGGALAASGGTEVALLVDALTFLAVAAFAALLHVRRKVEAAEEGAPPDRARDGFVFLWRDHVLGLVMAVTVASLCLFTITASAEVFFVVDDLDAGQFGYGIVLTAWTVGMALGATVLARRFGPGTMVAGALAMIVLQGLGIATGPVSVAYGATLAGYAIGGLAHGTKNVLVRTLVHERAPNRIRGRAFAAYNALRNVAEIGALALAGVLVTALGARGALYIAGFGPALIGLAGLMIYARGVERRPATALPD